MNISAAVAVVGMGPLSEAAQSSGKENDRAIH